MFSTFSSTFNKRNINEVDGDLHSSLNDVNCDHDCIPVTRRSSLKIGKWSYEEEQYAMNLIADFDNGLLGTFLVDILFSCFYLGLFFPLVSLLFSDDCEDGSTLRSYLARKLNCSPMRISKKFANQYIGKHVFIRRKATPYYVPFLPPIQVPTQLNSSSYDDSVSSPCSLSPSSTTDDSHSSMMKYPELENEIWKEVLLFYCGKTFIGATTPRNKEK
jgi:hypothetical protein